MLRRNSTIDGELASVDADRQESAVGKIQGCTGWKCVLHHEKPLSVYMELGTITSDIHGMLTGDESGLTYLYKLN